MNDVYTYRFVKNGRASEIHSDDEEELLRRAAEHLEAGHVLPVHIRHRREIVYDIRDITDAWQKRYLTDDPFPPLPRRPRAPALQPSRRPAR